MASSSHPLDIIDRSFLFLAAATVVLYLGLIGVTLWARHISVQNQRALCALKADRESEISVAYRFLVDHPNGIPGITPRLVHANIHNQQVTVHALRFLSC